MFCPKCGATNDDAARFCGACGTDMSAYLSQAGGQPAAQLPPQYQQPYQQPAQPGPYGYGGMVPRVASHLVWAIISFVFFFWPTAIAAIVYASRVNNRLAIGDFYGAQEASRKAKIWCWVSFIIAVVVWVVVAVVAVLAARASSGILNY